MKLFYGLAYGLSKVFFNLFYRHQVFGENHVPKGPCIIAANHASFYDPPILAISSKEEVIFLAKGTLFRNAFFKWLISHLNAYPLSGTVHDMASIKLIMQFLKEKKKIVIFPEGKRSFDGNLLPIKPGISFLMSRCQCPIVPVYIHGAYDVWPRQKFLPALWGKTACIFGSPLSWEDFENLPKKQAQEHLAVAIHHSLENLKEWYLNGAKGTPP